MTFQMMSKVAVNKRNANRIFKYLRQNSSLNGDDIRWNFGKFLVSKNGDIIGHYDKENPFDMKSDIEANL